MFTSNINDSTTPPEHIARWAPYLPYEVSIFHQKGQKVVHFNNLVILKKYTFTYLKKRYIII